MKGINDVWNMCIIKCTTNGYNDNKEEKLWAIEITPNEGELRDGVCLKALN